MSSPLTAHDVRKQPGITSIYGTSDVVKVSTVEAAATAVLKYLVLKTLKTPGRSCKS
jgi:hypothetical protein